MPTPLFQKAIYAVFHGLKGAGGRKPNQGHIQVEQPLNFRDQRVGRILRITAHPAATCQRWRITKLEIPSKVVRE
jgi:hypothetical protein